MYTFLVIKRDKNEWCVAFRGDVDEYYNLKPDRKPISSNHSDELEAKEERDKIEQKFGFDHADNPN